MLAAAVAAAGGTWRDVAALSEAQVAAAVRADGVDILVELTGHTASNRLGVMALRAAPVQVGHRAHAPTPPHNSSPGKLMRHSRRCLLVSRSKRPVHACVDANSARSVRCAVRGNEGPWYR